MRLYVRAAAWFDQDGARCRATIESEQLFIYVDDAIAAIIPMAASKEIARLISNFTDDGIFPNTPVGVKHWLSSTESEDGEEADSPNGATTE